MTIYTMGYSGWKIEDVQAVLERLDAILIDVRMVPRSRWAPTWNAPALHARLGERYVWLKEFGKPSGHTPGPCCALCPTHHRLDRDDSDLARPLLQIGQHDPVPADGAVGPTPLLAVFLRPAHQRRLGGTVPIG